MFLPRSVEENDSVLLCLMDLIVVVVGDHFLHHPLVFLGHRERLHVGFDLPVAEILDEGGQIGRLKVVHWLHPELLLVRVAGHVHVRPAVFEADALQFVFKLVLVADRESEI